MMYNMWCPSPQSSNSFAALYFSLTVELMAPEKIMICGTSFLGMNNVDMEIGTHIARAIPLANYPRPTESCQTPVVSR
jgi:hypothetical protein